MDGRVPRVRGRTSGAALALWVIVGLAVLVSACARRSSEGDDPDPAALEDRIISNVWRTESPRALEVGWFPTPCEAFDSVTVNETSERVEILLTVFVDPDGCAEPSSRVVRVELDQPLGDRVAWDANPFVKDTVAVEPPR